MQSAPAISNANRQIARAAGTVLITFVVAQLVGLLAKILLTNAFGTQGTLDAYLAANRFSETLFNLIAGGALGSAFIPTFSTLLARNDREGAWRLASAICNLILIVLTAVSLLSALFAPWVVRNLLAAGFTDPAKQALTAQLLRIQLPSAVIFGLSGLVMGILNANQRFLFPALTPALYQVGIIFGVEVLAPRMGIYGVAWGVVIGSGLHLLVQLPQLFRLPGARFTPSLGLHSADVREVLLLMGPRLVGVAVVQLNFWANTLIASYQPEGSYSAITIAFALMLMPEAAIAQSIAIAALPTFSAQVARGQPEQMRRSLASTLRGLLLLAIPASAGLMLLRRPIVALIYQRGAFTAHSTDLVAWALLWYAAGLVGHCVVEVVSRAFYALHDTRTPVMIGVVAMLLNIGLSLLFSNVFSRIGLPPHGGLALANSLATFLETAGLLVLMRRRLKGLHGGEILRSVGAAVTAAAAMGGILWLWLHYSAAQRNLVIVAGGILISGLVYGLVLVLLRVDEIRLVWGWLKGRMAHGLIR